MNEKAVNKLNSVFVNAYKVVGFALLALILVGLFSYLGVQGFFLVNHAWVAPTIVSPVDEHILNLSAKAAEQQVARDRLLAERAEAQARLDDARRTTTAQRAFQARFAIAIAADRQSKARELRAVEALRKDFAEADGEVKESKKAFAGLARTRSSTLLEASLLTREQHLTQNNQLAQIAQSVLSLAQAGVELDNRTHALRREVRSLDYVRRVAAGEEPAGPADISADAVLLTQEHMKSKLEGEKAEELVGALEQRIAAIEAALQRYDQLLASIADSPYLKAIAGDVTVAFVPYENLDQARPGAALYGCGFGFVWCTEVGVVRSVLAGETSMKHPVRHQMLRGTMVEIQLTDTRWARRDILHLGRPPLVL
jgi:hypothetical protein